VKLSEDEQVRIRAVLEVKVIVEFGEEKFEIRCSKRVTTSDRWSVYRDVRDMITLIVVQHKDWRENNNCCMSLPT
jgi:hypothetical protein